MIELLRLRFDGLVGDEPYIAGTAPVALVPPSSDIGFVLERHAYGQPVQLRGTQWGKVKNGFVVVVDVAVACDRFEVPDRVIPDAHGLDPRYVVLQHEH